MNGKFWSHGTDLDFTSSASLNILRPVSTHKKINTNPNVKLTAYFILTEAHKSINMQYSTLSKHS